ncbi:O-antigen ligase family protein [Bradyrhizobium ottawaense]|nr:O-antigen ligase family protein [Bradyrhizobium ottawaense]GMO16393.1 O-antigen ligase family protein [Bradyrhizobium sp. TM233]GMO63476.1 O-antigen ligase family protein [Bradyrhizobium ottawaense]GMO77915.1 O-antigen ligase family protein [Bradyrhizobium ottawaense]GMO94651.1 O-antigen ligase family protein [Bradyrhizobium ottawaense]
MSVRGADIKAGSWQATWRDSARWMRASDVAIVLLAASLPWSTSLVSIFAVIWLVTLFPTAEWTDVRAALSHPACYLPILLVLLAVVGTVWATDIPWQARYGGINPAVKLIAIPILIRHFEKTGQALWVAAAFLISCTAVMLLSWVMFLDPRLAFGTESLGVPVKNYIVQGQEFTLCAFGALGAAVHIQSQRRLILTLGFVTLGLAFIANMIFVASSRTAFVCIPILFVVFALRYFSRRRLAVLLLGAIFFGLLAWYASPYLRLRTEVVVTEYQAYRDNNASTSAGMRLEFWRKSLNFFSEAPILGHGTGSTRTLFERDAAGKSGVAAEVIGNPHNQTLNVAVQWGSIGVIVLYAMWFIHWRLFIGRKTLMSWLGLVAVTENILSSLFNSHLFDFAEGWMYVLTVGIAGGMLLRGSAGLKERGD